MANQDRMFHQDLGPVMNRCDLTSAGENVAYGYPTGRKVVQAWMNSPGHRANILEPSFRMLGMAMRRCDDGTPYAAQVFGRADHRGPGSARRWGARPPGNVAPRGRTRLRLRDQAAPGDDEDHRPGARPRRHARRDRRPRRAGRRPRPLGRPGERHPRHRPALAAAGRARPLHRRSPAGSTTSSSWSSSAARRTTPRPSPTPSASSARSRRPSRASRSAPSSPASTTPARRSSRSAPAPAGSTPPTSPRC